MSIRILIVDDEKLIRDLLTRTLESAGYEVGEAKDGGQAIEKLKRSTYRLVITDAVMPGKTGLDLLKWIKKEHPRMKVVILTGYSRDHDIAKFLLAGADDYLTKPVRMEALEEVVERLLGEPG